MVDLLYLVPIGLLCWGFYVFGRQCVEDGAIRAGVAYMNNKGQFCFIDLEGIFSRSKPSACHCPIVENFSRCWLYLPDGTTCPKHGDVSGAVIQNRTGGALTPFSSSCPINEQTGDGAVCGRCWYHLPDGKTCPRHGDVSKAVARYKESGELTLESDHRKESVDNK